MQRTCKASSQTPTIQTSDGFYAHTEVAHGNLRGNKDTATPRRAAPAVQTQHQQPLNTPIPNRALRHSTNDNHPNTDRLLSLNKKKSDSAGVAGVASSWLLCRREHSSGMLVSASAGQSHCTTRLNQARHATADQADMHHGQSEVHSHKAA
jgi:hypothetical protein